MEGGWGRQSSLGVQGGSRGWKAHTLHTSVTPHIRHHACLFSSHPPHPPTSTTGCASLSPRNACDATAIRNESEKLAESMLTSVMPAEDSTSPTKVTAAADPVPTSGPVAATSSSAARLGAIETKHVHRNAGDGRCSGGNVGAPNLEMRCKDRSYDDMQLPGAKAHTFAPSSTLLVFSYSSIPGRKAADARDAAEGTEKAEARGHDEGQVQLHAAPVGRPEVTPLVCTLKCGVWGVWDVGCGVWGGGRGAGVQV